MCGGEGWRPANDAPGWSAVFQQIRSLRFSFRCSAFRPKTRPHQTAKRLQMFFVRPTQPADNQQPDPSPRGDDPTAQASYSYPAANHRVSCRPAAEETKAQRPSRESTNRPATEQPAGHNEPARSASTFPKLTGRLASVKQWPERSAAARIFRHPPPATCVLTAHTENQRTHPARRSRVCAVAERTAP